MIKIIAIFLFVLGLMITSLFILRYFFVSPNKSKVFKKIGFQSKIQKTLCVEEHLVLDPKRRLVWLRHGNEGYLILLGQTTETILKGPVSLDKEAATLNKKISII